ncbi:hypothetical protein H4217_001650 [Coemansia sp. RSA 1939]|nr:hypothetical protein H4217_001650 [Coemansia sp. RSA 1939]
METTKSKEDGLQDIDSAILQRSMHGLAGYVGSILDYTRLDEPRHDDSDSAKKTHAELLAAGLTLDQLRRLKASIIRVTREQDLELSTAAIGWVYFEKLIWKRYVVKDNRKLVADL